MVIAMSDKATSIVSEIALSDIALIPVNCKFQFAYPWMKKPVSSQKIE